jgi:hypothetical protein
VEDGSPAGCVVSIPLALAGESFAFVALEDGSLIIEDQQGEEPLEPVATIVERRVTTPYRARGFRADAGRFLVIADPIDVIDLGTLVGESVQLVATASERRFTVDGVPVMQSPPPDLTAEADDAQPCIISASHIDEQWWELTVEELPAELAREDSAAIAEDTP